VRLVTVGDRTFRATVRPVPDSGTACPATSSIVNWQLFDIYRFDCWKVDAVVILRLYHCCNGFFIISALFTDNILEPRRWCVVIKLTKPSVFHN